MKRFMSVITMIVCACLAGAGVMPAFAEVTDFTEYEEWVEAGKTADRAELAELWQKYYTSPKILEQALACCPENTAENRAKAGECAKEYAMEWLSMLPLTEEQQQLMAAGEKEFAVRVIPYIFSNELIALKQGEIFTADEVRKAVDNFAFLLYVDDDVITLGKVGYDTDTGFEVSTMNLRDEEMLWKKRAEALEQVMDQAELLGGEFYGMESGLDGMEGAILLDGNQVSVYPNDADLLSGAALTGKEAEIYCMASHLQWQNQLDYNVAHADEQMVVGGGTGYGKTAADFYPQARFILYVRPWVIAGSVVLGLAVIGTIVLVIWKKRKMAK